MDLKRVALLVLVASLLVVAWAARPAVAQVATQPPSTGRLAKQVQETRRELAATGRQLEVVKQQLADERAIRQEQQDDAQYFFQAVTIIIAVASALIALVAIIATIAGYVVVRRYLHEQLRERASAAFADQGQPLLEQRLNAKMLEIDEQLARELELFRTATGGAS